MKWLKRGKGKGKHCSAVVKHLLGIPASTNRVPGFSPSCSTLLIQLSANVPGRQKMMAHVFGSLQDGIPGSRFGLT